MSGQIFVEKYQDPGNPIVSICINDVLFPNTHIDLGSIINIITLQTMEQLQLLNLHPTPTVLELVDRFKIKTKGVLYYVIVSLEYWEYLVEFMVL